MSKELQEKGLGESSSEWSKFYNPDTVLAITLTAQVLLSTLIEENNLENVL